MPRNKKPRATAPKLEIREVDPAGSMTLAQWQRVLSPEWSSRVDVHLGSVMGVATFQQGCQLIARKIAETPVLPMRKVAKGGWVPAEDYPTYRLLKYGVNGYQTPYTFWSTLLSRAVATGLGLARIIRQGGRVVGFEILENAQPRVDAEKNRVVYQIRGQTFDSRDLLEIRGVSFDGIGHESPIDLAAPLLRTRIAENRYQAGVYQNGASIKGILTSPGFLDEEQAAQQANAFAARHVGPDNSGRPAVLSGGMGWQPVEHSPADTKVVDSAKFGVSEVARILNLPGWIVNAPDAVKPASNEEGMAQFAVLTLSPWLTQVQQELDFKCVDPSDWGRIEHLYDIRGLVKADTKTLVDEAVRLSETGILSKNEGRALVGYDPVDDERMDGHFIGTNNQQAIETIGEGEASQPGVNRPDPEPTEEAGGQEGEAERALVGILADPLGRFARNDASALRRLASKDRFDLEAEAHFRGAVPKLAQALVPAVRAVNAIRGLALHPEAIARDVADAALAELRPLWQGFAPGEIAAPLESVLTTWADRATSLAGRLVGQKQGK